MSASEEPRSLRNRGAEVESEPTLRGLRGSTLALLAPQPPCATRPPRRPDPGQAAPERRQSRTAEGRREAVGAQRRSLTAAAEAPHSEPGSARASKQRRG